MGILEGKRILVTGVVTRRSIAYAIAREAQFAGAEIVLTSFGRARSLTERAAGTLPGEVDVLELDVRRPADLEALAAELKLRWDGLDGAVHAIAHAPPDALSGDFLSTPRASAEAAFATSAFSLKSLSAALVPLLRRAAEPGGSIVGLSFESSCAWPSYDWMGVAKAAMESVARYLARDLGRDRVRVNVVSAGPIATVASGQIPEFDAIERSYRTRAPLGWDGSDPTPVAQAACFLLSDGSRGISGQTVHVDGGARSVGCRSEREVAAGRDQVQHAAAGLER